MALRAAPQDEKRGSFLSRGSKGWFAHGNSRDAATDESSRQGDSHGGA